MGVDRRATNLGWAGSFFTDKPSEIRVKAINCVMFTLATLAQSPHHAQNLCGLRGLSGAAGVFILKQKEPPHAD
jgi:hypothetical protein